MDQRPFPWLKALPAAAPENTPAVDEKKSWPPDWKKLSPFLALFAILALSMASTFDAQKTPKSEKSRSLDALVLMIPTPKGEAILSETLKEVPIDAKSLSKQQILQLLRVEDFVKIQGRVRSKKDLPPNKPLFWSDLEFRHFSKKSSPLILYSKE